MRAAVVEDKQLGCYLIEKVVRVDRVREDAFFCEIPFLLSTVTCVQLIKQLGCCSSEHVIRCCSSPGICLFFVRFPFFVFQWYNMHDDDRGVACAIEEEVFYFS